MAVSVAGVPPDAFSDTGGWGNPLYDWDYMQSDNYNWWIRRLERGFSLTDRIGIDHFVDSQRIGQSRPESSDARNGRWVEGLGSAFFDAVKSQLEENLPIVAEDLGTIDDAVVELVRYADVPNMLVLQFAFGGESDNWYLPHQHGKKSVVYTGTHDNNTTLGWWHEASDRIQDHVRRYFGVDGHDIVWSMLRAALGSVADTTIIPVQDVLALDGSSRMNTPSVALGNWGWRLNSLDGLWHQTARLRDLAELYGRV